MVSLLLCLAGLGGCQPAYTGLIEGANGPIRLSEITAITQDADLSEDERREALQQLGITDPELIDLLIQGYPPT